MWQNGRAMLSERLRIAIIGCGRAAQRLHLPALDKIEDAEVVAVADVDRQAAERVAACFGIRGCYTTAEPILNNPEIDAVAVCVPARFHVATGCAVLEAGKHLLVEKPLGLDLASCDRLIESAARSPARTTVGFNLRCHRLIREAKRLIESDALGPIEAVLGKWTSAIRYREAVPPWRNRREEGGGALLEIAVHHFDLWRYLLGENIVEVFAASTAGELPDESVTVTARLAGGAIATGLFSEHTGDSNELEICGRKGRLRISLFRYDGLEFIATETAPGVAARIKKLAAKLGSLPLGVAVMREGGDFLTSYRRQWREFIDAIRNGTPVASTLSDGRAAVQAVLGAFESMERRAVVRLTDGVP